MGRGGRKSIEDLTRSWIPVAHTLVCICLLILSTCAMGMVLGAMSNDLTASLLQKRQPGGTFHARLTPPKALRIKILSLSLSYIYISERGSSSFLNFRYNLFLFSRIPHTPLKNSMIGEFSSWVTTQTASNTPNPKGLDLFFFFLFSPLSHIT